MRPLLPIRSISLLAFCVAFSQASAAPVYQPNGVNLTLGDVTHNQRVISANGNPAASAVVIGRDRAKDADGNVDTGLVWGISAGVEYGNVQEIFDTIDRLSAKYKPSNPGDGVDNPGQEPPDGKPPGWGLGEIIDTLYPDFRPALEAAAKELGTQVSILALMRAEGYAKAFASTDLTLLSARDMAGGNWTFGVGWSGAAKSYGLVDDIEFDFDAALQDLQDKFQASGILPGDLPETFDVIGDIDFTVDPTSGKIGMLINNDTSLLTKATKTTELSVGYSRQLLEASHGRLYAGVEAKYYDLKLSRINVRFGDITDSEELFDAIKNLEYRKDNGFGMDVGALWIGQRYQVGATLTNVNEPTFKYPKINFAPYSSVSIVKALIEDETYTMERQLKLETAFFTASDRWALNFGLDTNAIVDPVGDEFQWATVSVNFTTKTNWLKNIRLGYRENLAGSEITYVSAGVTAFKYFDFDLASALDTVKIDGDTLPRGLMLSIGFGVNF